MTYEGREFAGIFIVISYPNRGFLKNFPFL